MEFWRETTTFQTFGTLRHPRELGAKFKYFYVLQYEKYLKHAQIIVTDGNSVILDIQGLSKF